MIESAQANRRFLATLVGAINEADDAIRSRGRPREARALLDAYDPFESGRLFDALSALREIDDPTRTLEWAPRLLCQAGPFDRALFSTVEGSLWLPRALHVGHDETDPLGALVGQRLALTSTLIESDVVRKRTAVLVESTALEPRTHGALRAASAAYVAAPIVVGDAVIGLLHADLGASGRPLVDGHRDLVRIFAGVLGVLHERALVFERFAAQRAALAAGLAAAHEVTKREDAPLRIALTPSYAHATHPPRAPHRDELGLSEREREVLDHLARGASNTEVADELSISESTVKSHVKHIFRKLGATSRAEAIARYFRP